jgi:RNA polymerase sigma factor (sigma-70 family)
MTICKKDDALLQRVRQGDDQALAPHYDRYFIVVYSTALRVLHNLTAAERFSSDIFIEVRRSPERFMQTDGNLSALIAVTARNRAVAQPLKRVDPNDPMLAPAQPIENDQERKLTRERAHDIINELEVEQQMVLEMAFFDGMTAPEITAPTRSSRETVTGGTLNALQALRANRQSDTDTDSRLGKSWISVEKNSARFGLPLLF